MIEVGMRDQDEVDLRQMMNFKPGLFQSFDDFEPLRPDRIDEDVDLVSLNKKRRVADPSHAELTGSELGELGRDMRPLTFGEKRRNKHAGQIIALMPVAARSQRNSSRSFFGSLRGRLPNDFSTATFRERVRHNRGTILVC